MSDRVLCLWESVYPYMLSMGSPQRHHIVIYLHTLVSLTSHQLTTTMMLDTAETDAAMWLDPVLATLVADDQVL